jgi:hypothetical protein
MAWSVSSLCSVVASVAVVVLVAGVIGGALNYGGSGVDFQTMQRRGLAAGILAFFPLSYLFFRVFVRRMLLNHLQQPDTTPNGITASYPALRFLWPWIVYLVGSTVANVGAQFGLAIILRGVPSGFLPPALSLLTSLLVSYVIFRLVVSRLIAARFAKTTPTHNAIANLA